MIFNSANCMKLCMPSVISIILLKHCCAVVQAVSTPQPQAGPSIEDAAQLLSSVAQPLFLTLHSQHSDSLHSSQDQQVDSQDQQADSQQSTQHSDWLQAVDGNGITNSHDIVTSSDRYSSSTQNPHEELTHPHGPEGLTSDAQDLQIQVCLCKPCGF